MDGLDLLSVGGLGTFGLVIAWLLRASTTDRKDYREGVKTERNRWQTEVTAHEATRAMLEAERERRFKAEDLAARCANASERTAAELLELRQEIALLRQNVTRPG